MAARVSVHSVPDPLPGDATVRVAKVQLANDRADRRAEARWLAEVEHSGVVRLHSVSDDPFTIVTDHAGGTTLRTAAGPPVEAAATLAAVADILVDLHTAGRAHGKLTLDHVVLGADGPVLCSPDGRASDPSVDLEGIARCMADLGQQWLDRGVTASFGADWERLTERLRAGDDPSLSARRTAQQLRSMVATSGPGTPRFEHSAPRSWRGVALAASLITLAFGGLAVIRPTTADAEEGEQIVVEGRRYEVGAAGDQVVALDDPCDPSAPVLLLEPDTSIVWRYPSVGHEVQAEAFAVVPGATDLIPRRLEGAQAPAGQEACEVAVARGPAGATVLETWTD